MIRRLALTGAAATLFSVAVIVNLAILDVVTLHDVGSSLGKILGVLVVSVVALAGIALLVRAAARR